MDFAEQLRILETAQGSPALLALATVDLVHHSLPEAERTRIKDALVAAAVPHWCDRNFLAALLGTTPNDAHGMLGQLRALTVVEPFPARGEHAVNVHEATRLALREHLRTTDAARWQALSSRARAHVGQGPEPHARIETLYHLFATDQPAAAAVCEALDREFTDAGRPEVRHALALALSELTAAGWLTGSAEVEALLAPLELRNWREEGAQIEVEACRVLDLARAACQPSQIGRSLSLLGDVLQAQGHLDDALAAFREGLGISQRLGSGDPSNVNWQRDLAAAHASVGSILDAQGRPDNALISFRNALEILQRLASTNPANANWQRDVAVAHTWVGEIYKEQGHLDDALAAFGDALVILQHLASADPSNAGWQRELAIAHSEIGDILSTQGRLDDALLAFRKELDILQHLTSTDPSHAGWQRDLGVAHSWIGDISQKQGRVDDALAAFHQYLAISDRLAATDPTNAGWQHDLALAHNALGRALQRQGNQENAQSSFRAAVEVMERAVAMSPGTVGWKQELVNLKSWLGSSSES